MLINIDKTSGALIVIAMLVLVVLGYVLEMERHESEMDYIMAEVVKATSSLEKCNQYMDIFEWALDGNVTPFPHLKTKEAP